MVLVGFPEISEDVGCSVAIIVSPCLDSLPWKGRLTQEGCHWPSLAMNMEDSEEALWFWDSLRISCPPITGPPPWGPGLFGLTNKIKLGREAGFDFCFYRGKTQFVHSLLRRHVMSSPPQTCWKRLVNHSCSLTTPCRICPSSSLLLQKAKPARNMVMASLSPSVGTSTLPLAGSDSWPPAKHKKTQHLPCWADPNLACRINTFLQEACELGNPPLTASALSFGFFSLPLKLEAASIPPSLPTCPGWAELKRGAQGLQPLLMLNSMGGSFALGIDSHVI